MRKSDGKKNLATKLALSKNNQKKKKKKQKKDFFTKKFLKYRATPLSV